MAQCVPSSNDSNTSTEVSLSDILFSFVFFFQKYVVCDACRLRLPSSESSSILYITLIYPSSIQELMIQGMRMSSKVPLPMTKNTWV